jgi:ribosomal protein RSM22 (predicted rRNA methylase)
VIDETGDRLRTALAALLDGLPPRQATAAVDRLIARYRGSTPTGAPVLRDRADVAAYALYRMPATFKAATAALGALADRMPRWAPAAHIDVGGGTGAAAWAVAAIWKGAPGESRSTVLDWAEPALALGSELAAGALPGTRWRCERINSRLELPDTDLVTVSYVLGELTGADRRSVVAAAARAGRAVVLIEPGTPDGYLRIRAAREQLVEAGFRVGAPCPHSGACPIVPGGDWCHFAARVSRSSLHRRVKGGTLPYEDEKYSYVAAVRGDALPAGSRIVRRPQIRKGRVLLDLCAEAGTLHRETVTRRHGALYRAARNADWGATWG